MQKCAAENLFTLRLSLEFFGREGGTKFTSAVAMFYYAEHIDDAHAAEGKKHRRRNLENGMEKREKQNGMEIKGNG
jgi:hypothetical protein